jgi:hypothetical protein
VHHLVRMIEFRLNQGRRDGGASISLFAVGSINFLFREYPTLCQMLSLPSQQPDCVECQLVNALSFSVNQASFGALVARPISPTCKSAIRRGSADHEIDRN